MERLDSLGDATKAIDNAACANDARVKNIRREIQDLYKIHNPGKLRDIDKLLTKYAGNEDNLLKAMQKKYSNSKPASESMLSALEKPLTQWKYILKNYEGPISSEHNDGRQKQAIRQSRWNVDESMEWIRDDLDELAESINGQVIHEVTKHGQRRFVVCQKKNTLSTIDEHRIEATVQKMREIVRGRYDKQRKQKYSKKRTTDRRHSKRR